LIGFIEGFKEFSNVPKWYETFITAIDICGWLCCQWTEIVSKDKVMVSRIYPDLLSTRDFPHEQAQELTVS
jgi:hypothetical protein